MLKGMVGIIVFSLLSVCGMEAVAQSTDIKDSTSAFSYKIPPNPIRSVAYPNRTNLTLAPTSFAASFINPGFFCKQEVKMDKRLPIPLRIRLGSMQYCNWLEQKPGYTYPQQ